MITAKNIASFRACKRLIDAGIVLKTNVRWRVNHKDNNYPPSCLAEEGECHSEASLPAPSLGELKFGLLARRILEIVMESIITEK